jgi:cell division protease FtsH
LGRGSSKSRNPRVTPISFEAAEASEREIDLAVRDIVAVALKRASELPSQRRADLDAGVMLLLETETITADTFPALRQAAGAAPARPAAA